MKLKNFWAVILGFLNCFALIACAQEEKSLVEIDSSFTNNQIVLRTAPFTNTFKTNEPIFLELEYNSSNKIVFPNNYNLRIFYQNQKEWMEISEKTTQRYPKGDVVFSPDIHIPIAEAISVHPNLPGLLERYTLRIYVIGDMYGESGINQVAAFVDVELSPKDLSKNNLNS